VYGLDILGKDRVFGKSRNQWACLLAEQQRLELDLEKIIKLLELWANFGEYIFPELFIH
jgi:hypothetical protein